MRRANISKLKFFLVFGSLFVLSIAAAVWAAAIVFGIFTFGGFFVDWSGTDDKWSSGPGLYPTSGAKVLHYEGIDLNYSTEMLAGIFTKHLPYFMSLDYDAKQKFLLRVKAFLRAKHFSIHDKTGFKEMPVLVSGAAVQVSFGLDHYLLPNFPNIHIYPDAFMRNSPTPHLVEGNVSGQNINFSWKHFLQGFALPGDGENVGLHEMAHAYYCQYQLQPAPRDCFATHIGQFIQYGDKVLSTEKLPGNDLYSDYGLSNEQEFWAESVELFFEKPADLNDKHPELYSLMKQVLNQDPILKV